MRLFALSDIHVSHRENAAALAQLPRYPRDWLVLAGDVGESIEQLQYALDLFCARFARVIWVPGNHDLWTHPRKRDLRGDDKYRALVEKCREFGVLTPEDEYPVWPGAGPRTHIVPMFLLYDYTFRPADVSAEDAVPWAVRAGICCTDELLLHPHPYETRQAWCHARVASTLERLERLPADAATVLINHFPLRNDHAILPRIPEFRIWCGTELTENWHIRFRARAVVYGHLHIRGTRVASGVPFHEVSLGNPGQWRPERGIESYLTEVLPRSSAAAG